MCGCDNGYTPPTNAIEYQRIIGERDEAIAKVGQLYNVNARLCREKRELHTQLLAQQFLHNTSDKIIADQAAEIKHLEEVRDELYRQLPKPKPVTVESLDERIKRLENQIETLTNLVNFRI